MIVIVAIDDKGGMLFNGRRQSKDRVLCEDVLTMTRNSRLWMNAYSAKQFENHNGENIKQCEDFLDSATAEEYCFVENASLNPYEHKIEKIVLYKWNRVYPGDKFFDINLSDGKWHMSSVSEFQGFSHEKITKEIWDRC